MHDRDKFINLNEFLEGDRTFVIAEIGKNFIQSKEEKGLDEYISNAKNLIDAAADAGVDAVKFQTHEYSDEQAPIQVISPHFSGSDRYSWVKRNTDITPDRFWVEVKDYSKQKGLVFFSTPMSRKAAVKLDSIGVPLWKIGSGDVMDYLLLDFVAETKKPVIISTGMVSYAELEKAVSFLENKGAPVSILYCVSKYPAPASDFNLSSIQRLGEKFPQCTIGFSDHSVGDQEIPLAAVKVGARIIEKHFSLSRDLWGSDHKVSLTPEEMKTLVQKIKDREYLGVDSSPFYGDIDKELEGEKNQFRPYFFKTLTASKEIKKGTVITKEMLFAMRPALHLKGIPSNNLYEVVGKKSARDINKMEPITKDIIE
ncbi:MAG: hypothetical protein COV70_02220 [Parcubacteria group bacterium CG11_big_fil_rev_8_21_14_0_20_39_22]|nr:MAG: hypothetical protein COV70_02220 [Parcubacteria group bacterium CG11_big_fil_rev_8_21_14_0_20_39_22]